jgi:hypothetical protein
MHPTVRPPAQAGAIAIFPGSDHLVPSLDIPILMRKGKYAEFMSIAKNGPRN